MAKAATGNPRGIRIRVLLVASLLVGGGALVWPTPTALVPTPHEVPAVPRPQPAAATPAAVERIDVPCSDAAAPAAPAPVFAGPTWTVQARFLVRPGGSLPHDGFFRGVPVSVAADDAPAAARDPEGTLRLPFGARRATFLAAGYRAVEREVPPPQAGCVDFGDVVFVPDASVRVRLLGAPADAAVVFALGRFPDVPYEQAAAVVRDGIAEAVLPAPSQDDLLVTASAQPTERGTPWFAVEPQRVRLQTGEAASVELRAGAGVSVTVAVHGIAPLLAPQLQVALRLQDGNGTIPPHAERPSMRLDADGRARFLVPRGRCQLQVWWRFGKPMELRAIDGSGLVQELADGAVLDVEPTEPLVGVVVCERGEPVPSLLSSGRPVNGSAADPHLASCHAMTAAAFAAAPKLWYWTQGCGSRGIAPEAVRREAGIVWIDAERGGAEARLTVEVDIPEASQNALSLVAEPLQGGEPVRFPPRAPFAVVLAAGDYRVHWICNGTPGPEIEAKLTLAPGEQRQLRAVAPALQPWTARIVDRAPFGAQPCTATIDGQWALGASFDDRPLPFLLPMPPQPGMPTEIVLHWLKLRVPARVTSIDAGSRTFAIEHNLTAGDVVHVQSRGLGDGKRSFRLCSAMPETRFCSDLGDEIDVPMLPGSERSGCLCEVIDGRRQVTRWFTLQHGMRQQLIEPRGQWATVQLARQGVKATVLVEGVAGMDPFGAGQLACPGQLRVFVADGTVAVHVDLQPGGRQTFAPGLATMVVR